ncbi:hypothetical protein FLAG1_06136 [Fusarium langsethiae]|uniref:Uncharacterized protein n=1 Tax=Fusarium langsethiae TaxID=179993 RepID=A0A0N0DED2_FUSLA|nr:hypothetical protein FLAG1_06136 [Fusarium langsethiae]GKU03514.1 unnamed protein product [Fusarium langsethiae]
MALWPFRRRSSRKRSRSGAAFSDVEGAPLPHNEGAKVGLKKRRTEPPKPQQATRKYSFSPGRQDDIRNERVRGGSPAPERTGRTMTTGNLEERTGLWDRTPTLRPTRQATRKQRNKRRKEDRNREAEIKAMSSFVPVRPATEQWNSGRPMKRDSKRSKTSRFGKQRAGRDSDISLPVPGSIHSSFSSDSELGSYRVSAFAALAPRPTLRYTPNVRWTAPHLPTPHRQGSLRKKLLEQESIPEETMRSHRRIDSFADDLDTRDLRELMELDNRRREFKKQKERQRMERRITRRAEQQQEDNIQARKAGTPPPQNLERGVLGRELVGLGIEPASAVVVDTKPEDPEPMDITDDEKDPESSTRAEDALHHTDTVTSEQPAPMEEVVTKDTSSIRPPSEEAGRVSPGNRFSGLLRSAKSRSRSTIRSDRDRMVSPPPETIDEEDVHVPRQDSHQSDSSKNGFASIKAFLRIGSKRQRHEGPSSFANTSREEMQAAAAQSRAQAQAYALAKLEGEDSLNSSSANYLFRKPSTGAPKRTRSRFREDLPEMPLSPPASRVQSPEAEPPMPVLTEQKIREMEQLRSIGVRYDTPTSGHRSIETNRLTPSTMERVHVSPSPEAGMSMSLASIDSEGSWLSGNVNSRRAAIRDSIRRANQREQSENNIDSPTNSTDEDLGIVEDDYMTRLTPRRSSNPDMMARRSGEGRPSSDEEELADDGEMKWGAVGSQPKVVHRWTMKSHEGLLEIESEEEESPTSPVSPSQELANVQDARSVNLGRGHVRNFSAGSAKLLDITPRASVDARVSSERRRSHGLPAI